MEKLVCENGVDGDQLQIYLYEHYPEERKCVLVTGPNELHIISPDRCRMCDNSKHRASPDVAQLAGFFRGLPPSFRVRHYDFFKKYCATFRGPDLDYLMVPLVTASPAILQVAYLGVSHVGANAAGELFHMNLRNFRIDSITNQMILTLLKSFDGADGGGEPSRKRKR